MRRFAPLLCAATFLLAAPNLAEAQGWLGDREHEAGPGLRVGNLEFHPGLGAEVGYDSNVYYSDANEQASGILRITPHLRLSTLSQQRSEDGGEDDTPPTLNFDFGVFAAINHFFATAARTDADIGADLTLDILPERPFSISITDTLSRSIKPFTEPGAIDNNYAHINNNAGVRFSFGPEGGVLRGNVGYNFGFTYFEGATFQYANAFDHDINAGASFKFLPQTAIVYDFNTYMTSYPNDTGATTLRSDSVRLRSRLGVNGAITNNVSFLFMAGYAGGFYEVGDEYDDFVAQTELRFSIGENIKVPIGYERDYQRSVSGNFYRRDRGYASIEMLLGGTVLVGLDAGVGLYDFGTLLDASGMPMGTAGDGQREDIRVDASLFAEWRIRSWLAINGSLDYDGDFTDFEFANVGATGPVFDPAGYNKFQVFGGVRAFF
ncbi:MAG: hypothetical protein JRH11_04865 [Deltaproteobacteria bacterium]|nr:hypothetical protein [Deltaproteobacteria bacterium]